MEPLRVAVCEDQTNESEELLALLSNCAVDCIPTVFTSAEALLEAWSPHAFDVLLMDIYMNGLSGIDAVQRLRDRGEDLPVAFITSSKDHALDSYRLSALKYIEKPVRPERVDEMLRLARLIKSNEPSLLVKRGRTQESIPVSRIVYLEQQGHVANIHLKDQSVVSTYEKVSTISSQLAGQPFFQPHKSFLVHMLFVQRVDADLRCFVMAGGDNVPIRRDLLSKARRAWEDYNFARNRGLV